MSSLLNNNKEIIRVEDSTTFPPLLENFVINYMPEIENLMKNKNLNTFDFAPLSCNKGFRNFINYIIEYLDSFSIVGYHNTRVLDKSSIENNGLYLLEPNIFRSNIKKVFDELSIDQLEQEKAFNYFNNYLSNIHGTRTERICFFSPYRICQTFSKFALNIGGELCDYSLSENLPEVYSKFKSNGYPVTVEFRFNFSDIANSDKDTIAFEFVKFYLEKLVKSNNYSIEISGAIFSPVLPKDIISIYDFIDEFKDE